MTHFLILTAIVLRTAAFLLATIFAIRYSRRRWSISPEGRAVMSWAVVVAAFLAFVDANNITAYFNNYLPHGRLYVGYPGQLQLGVLLYFCIAYVMWRHNVLLTRAIRSARAEALALTRSAHPTSTD